MDLRHRAFDRELAALLFEQARTIHQFALIDLPNGLWRVEQRHRGKRVVAFAPLGRGLGHRLRIGQGQGGRWHRHLRRLWRREGLETAEQWCFGRRGGLLLVVLVPAGLDSRGFRRLAGLAQRRVGGGGRLDNRRCDPFFRVFGDDFAALFLPSPLFAPRVKRVDAANGATPETRDRHREEAPERELGGDDDREEDQREEDDHRAGPVQVFGHLLREEFPCVAAGAKRLARDVQRAEHQTEKRADTADQEHAAGGLGARRVERPAPEIVPSDDDHQRGNEVRRVAEELKRQLGEEGADASREVHRRRVHTAAAEEPHRVGRLVARE